LKGRPTLGGGLHMKMLEDDFAARASIHIVESDDILYLLADKDLALYNPIE
jgi:transcription initiation factor IIE alpha subunit